MKLRDAISMLKSKGYRTTPQRAAVLKVLVGNKRHPTAETIFRAASRNCRSLSMATVYNVLQMLEKENLVRSHNFSGIGLHYDPDVSDHAHFVCRKCSKIYDVSIRIPSWNSLIVDSKRGFEITDHDIILRGTCKSCLQKRSKIR